MSQSGAGRTVMLAAKPPKTSITITPSMISRHTPPLDRNPEQSEQDFNPPLIGPAHGGPQA